MAWQFTLNGLAAGSAYALVALAVALQYRTTGFLDFGHGAAIAIGAYLAFFVHNSVGLPLALACLVAIVISAFFGGLSQRIVYSPLQRQGATNTVLLIASLGIYVVAQNVVSLLAGDDVRTLISSPVSVIIGGGRITAIQIASIVLAITVFAFFRWITDNTSIGRQWRAVGTDQGLARVHGISMATVDWTVSSMSGAVCGLAGILIAADSSLFPTIGFRALLMGVVAAVIGGLSTPKAAFWGGIAVGLVQYLVAGLISTRWQDAGVFLLLLVFLFIRPKGLLKISKGALEH